MRPTRTEAFLLVAQQLARLSTCRRRKVGCVLTDKHQRIIGCGYNGSPAKVEHVCDVSCARAGCTAGERLNECLAIHAEANALMHCTDFKNVSCCYVWGATPCWECAKLLCNSGVTEIYADQTYTDSVDRRVLALLSQKKIDVIIVDLPAEVKNRVNDAPQVVKTTTLLIG